MKSKFTKGLCVILIAALFVSTGIILKIFSNKGPDNGELTDGEKQELIDDNNKPVVKEATFVDAPEGYFDDALFVGDSRTVGLKLYSPIEGATYFASVGLNVYKIDEIKVEVDGIGSVTLEELLKNNQYGKIYLMLGINELGNDFDTNVAKYKQLVKKIRKLQPDSIIFIEANLRVGAAKSNSDAVINNANIDKFNERISKFANNVDIVYIDVNPIFDDGTGNLNAASTGDSVHLYANYYSQWVDWFKTKAIVNQEKETLDTKTDE